jgi:hypothetical protein
LRRHWSRDTTIRGLRRFGASPGSPDRPRGACDTAARPPARFAGAGRNRAGADTRGATQASRTDSPGARQVQNQHPGEGQERRREGHPGGGRSRSLLTRLESPHTFVADPGNGTEAGSARALRFRFTADARVGAAGAGAAARPISTSGQQRRREREAQQLAGRTVRPHLPAIGCGTRPGQVALPVLAGGTAAAGAATALALWMGRAAGTATRARIRSDGLNGVGAWRLCCAAFFLDSPGDDLNTRPNLPEAKARFSSQGQLKPSSIVPRRP